MSISAVKQQIEVLLKFLEPHLGFANCHMVDFFTNSSYMSFVPPKIQKEIDEKGEESIIDSIFLNDFRDTPNLREFVENSTKLTLGNLHICQKIEDFNEILENWGCDIDKFKLEIFMTAKKSHEVEILSAVAASISKILQISHIVDLGDGKGYLSSMLALYHKIPVMGVDASNVNTCGAVKRVNKLAKIWKGIPEAPHRSQPKKNENLSTSNISLYKQTTEFVDENFDFEKLILENFKISLSTPLKIGLVGLHTCGDLAPNSLKIFIKNDSVKSVCNVGCCYHLLDENSGFPLSQFLQNQNFVLGRSARMIANQSVERILDSKDVPNVTIFYRALLQVILKQYCNEMPTKHVGKFRKLPQNFIEYVRIAMRRIDANIDISDNEIEEFLVKYEKRRSELNIFYLLRSKLSPVIESLILLDRLLFLKENGCENCYLVQLFNPVISPRCYGIVGMKNFVNE